MTTITNTGVTTTDLTSNTLETAGDILINTTGNPNLTVKTSGAGNNPFVRIQADTNYWDLQSIFSNTNDELDFRYNGSSKMMMTKDGHVTTPSQPMVRMSLGNHFGINNAHPSGPGGKITGFTVHENIGSHWNNSNSQFTCPVAGVYCVTAFFIKYPAAGAAHVDLHKNGSGFDSIRWRAHEGGSSYHQCGGTVFVSCAANDVLEWRQFGAPGIHSGNGQWGIRLVG